MTDTKVDQIADRIYRLSTFVPEIGPTGFTFNQFLVDAEEPLLYHTGMRQLFPLVREAVEKVLEPAVRQLAEDGAEYRGVLYAGLMLTAEGIRVLEFNARFGDPEAQVVLPRLRSDAVRLLLEAARGDLSPVGELEWDPRPCVGIVIASSGYPDAYETGFPIDGLATIPPGVLVFHAGTRYLPGQGLVTAGGRVLTMVALGDTQAEARDAVLGTIGRVRFNGAFHRHDIAQEISTIA